MSFTRKILPALALVIAFAPLAAHAQNAHAAPQTVQRFDPIMVGSATIDQPTTIYSGGVQCLSRLFRGLTDARPPNLPAPLPPLGSGCGKLRIPTEAGQGYRFDVGHRSDLKPATIPI